MTVSGNGLIPNSPSTGFQSTAQLEAVEMKVEDDDAGTRAMLVVSDGLLQHQ